jgi:phage/plasmid-like protein (TIGR03299 family)
MGHDIKATDGVMLYRQPAWHGLGMVVEDLKTPQEALAACGADWVVDQHPVWIWAGGKRFQVPDKMANFRSDLDPSHEDAYLGTVSEQYTPVDNDVLAQFCYDLAEAGKQVTVESCGTLQGGKRVWFLLHGGAFNIGGKDEVKQYLLASNSHDGKGSLRLTPTTVRVVCRNTLNMVVPATDTGVLGQSALCYRHTGSIHDRLETAKAALAAWDHAGEKTRELCDKMAAVTMTDAERQAYFFRRYELDFGAIDPKDDRSVGRGADAYLSFRKRWDDEKELTGGSLWGAFNAYSGLVQHDSKARGKDDTARVERRIEGNLFGLQAQRTSAAFGDALQLLGA